MPESIYLEESLIARLRERASAENESTEDFLRCVLTCELDRFDTSAQWRTLNGRRLALVRKRYQTGLTSEEEAELRGLQLTAAYWLEAHDNKLLESVRRMEEAVLRLPAEPENHAG